MWQVEDLFLLSLLLVAVFFFFFSEGAYFAGMALFFGGRL